jgi:hypothetical protein
MRFVLPSISLALKPYSFVVEDFSEKKITKKKLDWKWVGGH